MSSCSLCGAIGTNKKNCPYNKDSISVDPESHLIDNYNGRMPDGYSFLSKIDYPEEYDQTKSLVFKGSNLIDQFYNKNMEVVEQHLNYIDYNSDQVIISFKTNIYDDNLCISIYLKIPNKFVKDKYYLLHIIENIVDYFEEHPRSKSYFPEWLINEINFKFGKEIPVLKK